MWWVLIIKRGNIDSYLLFMYHVPPTIAKMAIITRAYVPQEVLVAVAEEALFVVFPALLLIIRG